MYNSFQEKFATEQFWIWCMQEKAFNKTREAKRKIRNICASFAAAVAIITSPVISADADNWHNNHSQPEYTTSKINLKNLSVEPSVKEGTSLNKWASIENIQDTVKSLINRFIK